LGGELLALGFPGFQGYSANAPPVGMSATSKYCRRFALRGKTGVGRQPRIASGIDVRASLPQSSPLRQWRNENVTMDWCQRPAPDVGAIFEMGLIPALSAAKVTALQSAISRQ
jgi:hypothetical protein